MVSKTTKQSLLPNTLKGSISTEHSLTVFTTLNQRLYTVAIPRHSKTIAELLEEAVEQFNSDYDLDLSSQNHEYSLYPARKSGKRCSDFPAMDPSQDVILTKINYYYLQTRKAGVTTLSLPKTEISLQVERKD